MLQYHLVLLKIKSIHSKFPLGKTFHTFAKLTYQYNFLIKEKINMLAVQFTWLRFMVPGDRSDCKGLQASQDSQDDAKLTTTF